jgi:nitrate reductase beta subunit
VPDEHDLYEAQREILLDPNDPEVIAGARAEGISDEWIEAAQRSPVYALINEFRVALPLHPEFRTVPMVWYIPPLSPVVDAVSRDGHDGEDWGICSARSTPCASRSNTWPACSPPGMSRRSRRCCTGWRPCGPTCVT